MLYHIGDKFLVRNILSEVKYINCGKAWVAPVEDVTVDDKVYLKCVTFEVLDSKGKDSNGNKSQVVVNKECQAV